MQIFKDISQAVADIRALIAEIHLLLDRIDNMEIPVAVEPPPQ